MTDAPPAEPAPPPAPPPELVPALALFDRGDFRGATAACRALLASSPEVAAAARALLERMAPDPWALRFGIAVLALLALLVGIYIG